MFIDDKPPYAVDDPDYAMLDDIDDIVILRMIKVHEELVAQRYPGAPRMVYRDFNGPKNFRHTTAYKLTKRLAGMLVKAGVLDPSHFIAFVFEMWASPRHHDLQVQRLAEKGITGRLGSGVKYPSLTHIVQDGDDLLEQFLLIPNYKPTHFVPADDHAAFDRQVMQHKVERWCISNDKTLQDYWLESRHLFPPFLDWRYINYADSLWACDSLIQAAFGFSVGELREFLIQLEQAVDEYHQEHPGVPSFVTKVEWDEQEVDQERIDLFQEAIDRDVDVTSESFQQGVEEVINPIDLKNTDTLAWYFFGLGKPRRRDGEEIDLDEPIGTSK